MEFEKSDTVEQFLNKLSKESDRLEKEMNKYKISDIEWFKLDSRRNDLLHLSASIHRAIN